MIAAISLAAALALGADDACAPVEAAGAPDPAAAAQYRAVADSERAAGSRDTAAAAYRAALAHDPADAHSRAALAHLCAEAKRSSAFDRGLARMRAGDRAGAVADFEEARAGGPDTSAALLEGICLYEMGEDARARPLLEEAAQDPVHRDPARFFLGLVAMRAGRSDDAAALLEASAADRRLGPIAMDLARMAKRDGRVVLSFLMDGGYDSNVDLTPDGTPRSAHTGDASGGLTALARVTPLGETGPFLRGTGVMRNQATSNALDLRGGGVAAGWQGGHAGRYLLGEWGWDYRRIGDTTLSAQRLLGSVRADLGSRGSVGLTYFARWESFSGIDFTGTDDTQYSGLRHFAEGDVTFALAPRSTATLAWHGGLDGTNDPLDAWREQGPRASLRLALDRDMRLGVDAAYTWRQYDSYDAQLGTTRADAYLDVAGVLERELGERWTLRASLAVRKAFSNVPDFSYTKIVPSIGLAWTIGLF